MRLDNTSYPAFLMIRQPPPLAEAQRRAVEWILATWMCMLDSNVLGVRRVKDERNGRVIRMMHIAIPLEYQRRQLAKTLGLSQIEDELATPRVNLGGSKGFNEPHSFIRIPFTTVMKRFSAFVRASVRSKHVNDETIGEPDSTIDGDTRFSRRKRSTEDARLRSAVRHALAMRNAAIEPHHIQTLVDRETSEKWIRIRNVERGVRAALRTVIKQAGIRRASSSAGDGTEWAVVFPESEAKKLLF